MSEMIQFVRNYSDLSTDKGYQFRFDCDKCGNGYLSPFESSALGTAAGFLRAAGDMFGGVFNSAGNSAYDIQRAIGGKAHDNALHKAITAGRQHFNQCTRCGRWVCPEVCWNSFAGMCDGCAPKEQEELAAAKARATMEQIHERARQEVYTQGLDFSKSGLAHCTGCGAAMTSATKFCSECGAPNTAAEPKIRFCTECGTPREPGSKFCPGCGAQH
jgi:hypothetical protein